MRTINPTVLKVSVQRHTLRTILMSLPVYGTGIEDPLRSTSETYTEEDVLNSMLFHAPALSLY